MGRGPGYQWHCACGRFVKSHHNHCLCGGHFSSAVTPAQEQWVPEHSVRDRCHNEDRHDWANGRGPPGPAVRFKSLGRQFGSESGEPDRRSQAAIIQCVLANISPISLAEAQQHVEWTDPPDPASAQVEQFARKIYEKIEALALMIHHAQSVGEETEGFKYKIAMFLLLIARTNTWEVQLEDTKAFRDQMVHRLHANQAKQRELEKQERIFEENIGHIDENMTYIQQAIDDQKKQESMKMPASEQLPRHHFAVAEGSAGSAHSSTLISLQVPFAGVFQPAATDALQPGQSKDPPPHAPVGMAQSSACRTAPLQAPAPQAEFSAQLRALQQKQQAQQQDIERWMQQMQMLCGKGYTFGAQGPRAKGTGGGTTPYLPPPPWIAPPSPSHEAADACTAINPAPVAPSASLPLVALSPTPTGPIPTKEEMQAASAAAAGAAARAQAAMAACLEARTNNHARMTQSQEADPTLCRELPGKKEQEEMHLLPGHLMPHHQTAGSRQEVLPERVKLGHERPKPAAPTPAPKYQRLDGYEEAAVDIKDA